MAQLKVKGIISYPNLFQPRSINPKDDPKYSVAVLIRKDDPQIQQIEALIETEKSNSFPSGFPANGKCCLKDCAVIYSDRPELSNYYVITANANQNQKPHVVDSNMQPVLDPGAVYAGAVAWFALSVYGYNKPVNKGVGAGVNGVMITGGEGELGRLDGRPSVEQMFADVGGTPAPSAPTPPAPVPTPASPGFTMTEKANGITREQYHASGWTDEQLVSNGMMESAVATSFS